MWTLSVTGLDKLIWLQPAHSYTIGRSPQCDIVLDKRFISSKHIVFKVGGHGDNETEKLEFLSRSEATPCQLVLESGATTYIDEKRYRKASGDSNETRPLVFDVTKDTIKKISFRKAEDVVDIVLRWEPMTISYSFAKQCIITNRDPKMNLESLLFETAGTFDFRVRQGVRSTTDCYLDVNDSHDIAHLAYSLLHMIPVVDESYLWTLLENKEYVIANFENFPKAERSAPSTELEQKEERKTLFKNTMFFTTDQISADYFKPLVGDAKGLLTFLKGDDSELWIKQIAQCTERLPVLIQFFSLEKLHSLNASDVSTTKFEMIDCLCENLNKKLFKGEEFLSAVLTCDTKIFDAPYNKRKAEVQTSGARRKRRNVGTQTRIDPWAHLASAETTAVAEPVTQNEEKIAIDDEVESQPAKALSRSRARKVQKIDATSLFQEYSRTPIASQNQDIPRAQENQEVQDEEVANSEPEEPIAIPSSSPMRQGPKEYHVDVANLQNSIAEQEQLDTETNGTRTGSKERPSTAVIDAIKQIKTGKKQLEKEHEEESSLKPEDINIQDLVIVESVDLIKDTRSLAKGDDVVWSVSFDNSRWSGRKNFKTFSKVPPKKQPRSPSEPYVRYNSNGIGLSTATINYLPLDEYKEGQDVDEDEQYFAARERAEKEDDLSQRQEVEQFFDDHVRQTKTKSRKPQQQLFVQSDEDDSESETQASFSTYRSRPRNNGSRAVSTKKQVVNLNVSSDDDDDDDMRGSRFRFTRR